jgi:hypothetical protein
MEIIIRELSDSPTIEALLPWRTVFRRAGVVAPAKNLAAVAKNKAKKK